MENGAEHGPCPRSLSCKKHSTRRVDHVDATDNIKKEPPYHQIPSPEIWQVSSISRPAKSLPRQMAIPRKLRPRKRTPDSSHGLRNSERAQFYGNYHTDPLPAGPRTSAMSQPKTTPSPSSNEPSNLPMSVPKSSYTPS